MKIIYYVTSHGYGHGVRTVGIANQFSQGAEIVFRTALPEAFFREEVRRDFSYAPASFDCGCVQSDGLHVDIEKTLAAYRSIAARNSFLLESEAQWCRGQKADVIASDIVPFAFQVAEICGIPSVAVTNFTWYDIYEEYVRQFPAYRAELETVRAQYASATLALALEPALPMGFFKKRLAVPPVGRTGRDRRAEIERKYGVLPHKHIALVYFGHFGLEGVDWRKLSAFADWEFLGVFDLPAAPSNYRRISKADFMYQDLAASVDCMVCKIGYGAVAEAMIHGTPLLYLPRFDFAEYPVLDAAVRSWGGGHCLAGGAFRALDWKEPLAEIVARGRLRPVRSDGAQQCARAIEGAARPAMSG